MAYDNGKFYISIIFDSAGNLTTRQYEKLYPISTDLYLAEFGLSFAIFRLIGNKQIFSLVPDHSESGECGLISVDLEIGSRFLNGLVPIPQ